MHTYSFNAIGFKAGQFCCMVVNRNIKHDRIRTSCESGHNIDTMCHTLLVHKPSSEAAFTRQRYQVKTKTFVSVLVVRLHQNDENA